MIFHVYVENKLLLIKIFLEWTNFCWMFWHIKIQKIYFWNKQPTRDTIDYPRDPISLQKQKTKKGKIVHPKIQLKNENTSRLQQN